MPVLGQEVSQTGEISSISPPVRGKVRVKWPEAVFLPRNPVLGLHLRGVLWQVLEPLVPLDVGIEL